MKLGLYEIQLREIKQHRFKQLTRGCVISLIWFSYRPSFDNREYYTHSNCDIHHNKVSIQFSFIIIWKMIYVICLKCGFFSKILTRTLIFSVFIFKSEKCMPKNVHTIFLDKMYFTIILSPISCRWNFVDIFINKKVLARQRSEVLVKSGLPSRTKYRPHYLHN